MLMLLPGETVRVIAWLEVEYVVLVQNEKQCIKDSKRHLNA
jgi:hypothetical protein